MSKNLSYQRTIYACFTSAAVQAIICNFAPLLFLIFNRSYQIPLSKITFLITVNFLVQLAVDLIATGVVSKIGYRISIVASQFLAALGFVLLAVLPDLCSDPYIGIMTATVTYAMGGGLIEVLASPIMEACPTDNKEKSMSLLHSFFCWGHVVVVLVTTIFFKIFGTENWRIMTLIWALVPFINAFAFLGAPIATLEDEEEQGVPIKELLLSKVFWVFMIMMLCSGASEIAVSQWASVFAEKGLGVSKAIGDLAGPMAFAILMGSSRFYYGKCGDKMDLDRFMLLSSILCVISYLAISFIDNPIVGLIGCAVCGLSVGIMWPGTLSKASAMLKGGTAMFALFAVAGDVGCSAGPTLAGLVSSSMGDNLRIGILSAIVFPLILLACVIGFRKKTTP